MTDSPSTPPKETRPEKPPEVKQATTEQERQEAPSDDRQAARWSLTDENNWETFPASDAPAAWAGRDISPTEREARARAQKPHAGR